MDLELLKKEHEPKIGVQVRLYQSTIAKIEEIAKREGVKTSWIIRHVLNKALAEMDASEVKTNTVMETK